MTRRWAVLASACLVVAGCGGGSEAHANNHPASSAVPPVAPAGRATDAAEADRLAREARYHADLGAVHLNHGKIDAAIAAYQKAIEVQRGVSEDAGHIWALGKAYQAKGDTVRHREQLERAAALFTGFAGEQERAQLHDYYCAQLAMVYGEMGEPQKAVEWVDQMAAEGDAEANALRDKARLYVQFGMPAKALGVLEEAERRAQPGIDRERAAYNLAEVLAGMKRTDEAIARLKPLSESAAEPGLRAEAKRLLFKIYDVTGKLDNLRLGGEGGEKPVSGPPGGGE